MELRDAAGWGSWEGAGRFDNVRLVLDDGSPPVASASASPTSGHPPLDVQLTGACSDPDGDCGARWWDFGDGPSDNSQQGGGATSTQVAPAHTFARERDYWVAFTAMDKKGAASTSFTLVRVANLTPAVTIAASAASGPSPHGTAFEALVVDDDDTHTYAWSFGDGATSSEATPTHTFATAGTYLVTVSVTDPLGAAGGASFAVVATGARPIANGDFSDGLAGWVTEAHAWATQDDAVHGTALNLTAYFYRSHAWQVAALDVDAHDSVRLRLDVKLMTFNTWYSGPMVARVFAGGPPSYDQTLVGTHVFAPGDLSETSALDGTTQLPMAVWYAWTSEDLAPLLPPGTQFVRVELWDVVGGWEGGGRFDNVRLVLDDDAIPAASATADPLSGHPPLEVWLEGACVDADGDCASQWWDFGDGPIANGTPGGGETSTLASTSYTLDVEDTRVISYTVEDARGAASTTFVTVTAVNEAPIAAIVAVPPSGPAPLATTFTAVVVDDDETHTYLWDFGDGATSSEASPTHEFQTAGTHRVTVTVSDPLGAADTASFVVVATGGAPIANGDFSAGLSGWVTEACAWPTQDDAVHGTALNLTACFYRSHAWQVAAVDVDAHDSVRLRLDVKLMTYNGSYVGPMVAKVYAGHAPSYDQTLVGTHRFVPGSLSESAALEGTTSLPMAVWYAWTSEDLAPLLPVGTQFVRVELWDTIDGAEGGGRFDNVTVVLDGGPAPVASLDADPTFGPAPLEVALSGSCSGDCAAQWWDLGDGPTANGTAGGGSTSTASDVTWTFTGDQSYTVTFTVEDTFGAASTAVQTVSSIHAPPVVTIVASPGTGPAPLSVQLDADVTVSAGTSISGYAWSFGDGGQSSEQSPSHVFVDPGTYLVTLMVTDDQGATSSASYVIIVSAP